MTLDLDERFKIVKYDPDRRIEPVPWLIEGLFQWGKINGIAGFEKSGKSRLLNWLLVGMWNSTALNMTCLTPRKVLYLCGEETVDIVSQRVSRYATLQSVKFGTILSLYLMDASAMRLDLATQREWLIRTITEHGFDTIIMDPLRRLHAADEDKSTQMAPIHNDLRRWSNYYGITIILVHHTPKLTVDSNMDRIATWFRGSTDLAAILDTATYVDRLTKVNLRILRQGRYAPLEPLDILDLGDDYGFKLK